MSLMATVIAVPAFGGSAFVQWVQIGVTLAIVLAVGYASGAIQPKRTSQKLLGALLLAVVFAGMYASVASAAIYYDTTYYCSWFWFDWFTC